MVEIHLPPQLRPYADDAPIVHVSGRTVGEALHELTARHAGLQARLFDDNGALRPFIELYLDDADTRRLAREETLVGDADSVAVVSDVAGSTEEADLTSTAGEGAHDSASL